MKKSILFYLPVLLLVAACGLPPETGLPPSSPLPPIVAPTQPPPAQAGTTYYVAMGGADGADGSTDHPWATLQHAVDSVAPGDTIVVREGEYVGCRIERSGTAGAWITLQAEAGATVQITAPGLGNAHNSNIEVETWEGDGTVAYWIIQGLEVSGAPSWGIDIRASESAHTHHVIVRYNRVHDNGLGTGRTGIFLAFVDDALIEFNESDHNGEHGIYCSNSGDRPVVRGNVLHDNVGCGVHMNGDESMGGDGVISDGVVERNVIYENGVEGGAAINMDGVENTIVRNNLLYNNHAGGIAIFQENGGICSSGNRVLNNTIVMPADGRWAINIADPECVNNVLFNNIILTHHSWRGSVTIPEAGLSGFQSDYNIVEDRFSADGDNSTITLAAWQALGYDAHSLIATTDQLFQDEAGADYHLLPGGPAVDAGTVLADVTKDLDGVPRPWGPAYDIGAYEYREVASWVFLPVVFKRPS
jgi:hypothetical protein